MDDLTIGQLAERADVPVRTIRFWSDAGILPPSGRSEGGYRLYGPEAAARLDLVRTLRELGLGLGLDDTAAVLAGETTVADIATRHVTALDAQIRALRLNRAVLSTVARRGSSTAETALLNRLARLPVADRAAIVEDFMREVAAGLDARPGIGERLDRAPIDLPDDPTAEQVDAWLDLAELIQDPGFRARMRTMMETVVPGRPAGAGIWFAGHVTEVVADARDRGIAPESPDAGAVLDRLFPGAGRGEVLRCLEAGLAADAERFRQLLRTVHGHEPRPSRTAELSWLEQALRLSPR
ncbi:MerR family DNA-binding transcriptional regulator [Couchioplanes caeruleus]|uniref:MerR family transcriptional regulator n=1 Tax=Couchioplanes caeruleus TaxID=56438 RepID=UPI00201C5375|nr:MerR family DNA-binding transcriptional regulator [Couchioplanes caeruleus]UQU62873.1 MerR family DNA-binding transcriptional regulator [Couchioplanes caeruleus]